jgi:hypothetical protein
MATTMYVDLDSMDIVSHVFLQRKHLRYKNVDFNADDLLAMNAATLTEGGTGDKATGKAVLVGQVYQREYVSYTPEELHQQALGALAATDANMPRVVEDLIDALIANGSLLMSDLPQEAQDKINDRKAKRAAL